MNSLITKIPKSLELRSTDMNWQNLIVHLNSREKRAEHKRMFLLEVKPVILSAQFFLVVTSRFALLNIEPLFQILWLKLNHMKVIWSKVQ